ncbi:MAG: ABC transporter substrate-binding protein/permease [Clostridiales bacterium]|nr:ABC transporter substrate-binding protein/permease [Candidatus Crickella equi]
MKTDIRKMLILIPMLIAVVALTSCAGSSDRAYPKSLDDLNGLRAGVVVGTIHDAVTQKHFPDSEISYVNEYADEIAALQNNKIDYFLIDGLKAKHMAGQTDDVTTIEEVIQTQDFGFIFKKDSKESDALQAQFNEYIAASEADGTLENLRHKWLDDTDYAVEHAEPLDFTFTAENGNLNLAVCNTSPPYSFVSGTELNGFDIEFAAMFCKKYGYGLTISASDFGGIIPAVVSGKCDFGASSLSYTEERAKSVDFSDCYQTSDILAVVAKENVSAFSLEGIKYSFERTFIHEDRWKNVLGGLLTTLNIFVMSAILGTLLGLVVYMLCRKGNKVLNKFFDAFTWLFSGIPMVVILMILYYIIFGKSDISGTVVSIIAFGISTMLSVYSLMKVSVLSIDRGQIEGAYSLGFTDRQTFWKIVFPQAMTQFMPNYKSTLVSMLKGTAIVGYIAVQDLTKISDVIRARTYEAFFPLIATALIYLALVLIITAFIKKVSISFEPKKRTEEKILKKYKL